MPRFRLSVVAALAGLLLASCSDAQPPAALVGETEITDVQVTDTADLFRFLSSIGQQPCGQLSGDGDTEAAACNRLALTNLLQFQVANDYAVANGIEAPAGEIDDAIAQLEEQLGPEAFAQQLTENGTTSQELRGLARDFSVLRQVATSVTEDELGDDGIRSRYEEGIASYTTVDVDHVLLETEEEADEVYAEVTAPGATREDFLAIAEERSIDPTAAENSGSLGSAAAGGYVPEFANAALALEPGEISEPVQTQYGWHVIRLEDAEVTPLSEARTQIVEQAAAELFPAWLRTELDDVEVNPRYGRFDTETLTVERIASTDPDASPTPSDGPVNAPASP
jgi:parvulin-like peptidyl-prolyl isomerase